MGSRLLLCVQAPGAGVRGNGAHGRGGSSDSGRVSSWLMDADETIGLAVCCVPTHGAYNSRGREVIPRSVADSSGSAQKLLQC